tara:strand:+ start:871 stop:1671 length:801 start_codon:yes stop_codon:yes gene_type:complete
MPFIQTKGPKKGLCNICGTHGKLTEDHVPPKGTIKFPRMTLYGIGEVLNAKAEKDRKGRDFQQGVKFRSICSVCNNDYLGGLYDQELKNFANDVGSYLHSLVARPNSTTFPVVPGKIIRAVCGHILALGVERFPRGDMGDAMADLVLNPDKEIPDSLHFYYWVYPFWDQVAIRNFGFLVHTGTPPLVSSVLKFFPLAFMILWEPATDFRSSLVRLNDYCVGAGNNQVDIPFRLTNIPPQRFPEAPGDSGVTLHGSDSYFSSRLRRL